MACDNLILYFNPDEAKVCNTDVTSLSTGAIKRSIIQRENVLYNKEGTTQGTINALINISIYESTPNITNSILNYSFTINKDTFIEKYSVINSTLETRDSRGYVKINTVRFFNLTSVEGSPSYTKLKWILPVDEQGNPLTRTLVFYN